MPKNSPNAKAFRLTEEANAVDYVLKACEFIRRVKRDHLAWKWVVISLHSALYSFAICALSGTHSARVTRPRKRGTAWLIGFTEAIRRCQDDRWMRIYSSSRSLQLTSEQKQSIEYLHTVRNQIEHFKPMHWMTSEQSLAPMAIDVLEVVRFLALDSGNVSPELDKLSPHQATQVRDATTKGTDLLQASQPYKAWLAASKRLQRKTRPADPLRA